MVGGSPDGRMPQVEVTLTVRQWLAPRRLLLLFLCAMLLFVGATGWLGWRFLQQDRALDAQRVRERLENATDLVAGELRRELAEVEGGLARLSSLPEAELAAAAELLAAALGDDALIAIIGPEGTTAFPASRLIYQAWIPAPTLPPAGTYDEGEGHEFRTGRYDRAIVAYRAQAGSDDAIVRAGALLRVARTLRKSGRPDDALDVYDELDGLGNTPTEGLPAALRASHARCTLLLQEQRYSELQEQALELRTLLYAPAWAIDRPAFLHHAAEVERFLAAASDAGIRAKPERRSDASSFEQASLALAAGVALLWEEGQREHASGVEPAGRLNVWLEGQPVLVLSQHHDGRLLGLVGGSRFLSDRLLASSLPLLRMHAAGLILTGADGETVLAANLPTNPDAARDPGNLSSSGDPTDPTGFDPADRLAETSESAAWVVRRATNQTRLPWGLRIVSADPAADQERFTGRRRLLMTAAGMILLLVLAGTYFSTRVVARELEVARMQQEFVAAVSHDFRTPLTSLRQTTEALSGDRVPEPRRADYYGTQMRAIDRLQHMVEGLLDFARMEAGAEVFDRRLVPVRQWLEGVVDGFRRQVEQQGYAVEFAWTGADAMARIDEEALARALWNLLDNAVKYSPDCKTVWVEAAVSDHPGAPPQRNMVGNGLTIRVRDQGVGVDPAEQRQIFAKFTRGSAAARSPGGGTGLGLALVQRIVAGHGGRIEVDSEPGQGSTFVIHLPIEAENIERENNESRSDEPESDEP